ncbi:MAG: [protein-PII] uridylyltransferase, partial [Pseudomonadota bacterium]
MKHTIIDKKTFSEVINRHSSPDSAVAEIMPIVKDYYAKRRESLKQSFLLNRKANLYVLENSRLVDSIIELLCEVLGHYLKDTIISIIAVGGYGRSELFPYSDIDLLFIHEENDNQATEFASRLIYCLWDINLTVSQAVRTIKQTIIAAKSDVSICTNLLDSRLIFGSEKLFSEMQEKFSKFQEQSGTIDFVEAKLGEHDNRHLRCGDSRYVLEPNIKEGKGGLRDLHTLYWLVKYIYKIKNYDDISKIGILNRDEYKLFSQANDFLSLVRVNLHLIAGRAEERLTFDMQRLVSEKLGYHDDKASRSIERFMKQYFLVAKNIGNLTRSVCAVLDENGKRKPRIDIGNVIANAAKIDDFQIEFGRLTLILDDDFERKPYLLIKLFEVAHEQGLDIHPNTMQIVGRNLWRIDSILRRKEQANNSFMNILLSLKNPEAILRKMNDAGVLGKFIPDFGKVIGQMQFDMYHVFTVDEHTIFAIGILHAIGSGKYKEEMPIASEIFHLVKSKRVLFLALLCHDIAKGRGGDHSVTGELVARKLARRFGFSSYETDTCAWLVRNHLIMSRTAFKRDLGEEKTITDFVEIVQSPERLTLLMLLTTADIRAVGPKVWNGWKASLLRELYIASEEKLGSDRKLQRKEAKKLHDELELLLPNWQENELDDYVYQIETSGARGIDTATIAIIAGIIREVATSVNPLAINVKSDPSRATTEIIIATQDCNGLFAKTSGAIALAGANILSAKIFT